MGDRIPKNDTVSLLDDNGYSPVGHVSQSNSHHSGGSSSSSSQATSRCLHVGNVAAHLTEEELRRQFSVYGHIQALKLVVQKDRRFAFVNYSTMDEAMTAKRELSKQSLWRSNVSYAKRETISISSRQKQIAAEQRNWCRSRSPGPSRFLCLRGLHTSRRKNQLMDLVSKCTGVITTNFVGREQNNAVIEFTKVQDSVKAHQLLNGRQMGEFALDVWFGRQQNLERPRPAPKQHSKTVTSKPTRSHDRDEHGWSVVVNRKHRNRMMDDDKRAPGLTSEGSLDTATMVHFLRSALQRSNVRSRGKGNGMALDSLEGMLLDHFRRDSRFTAELHREGGLLSFLFRTRTTFSVRDNFVGKPVVSLTHT